MMTRKLPIIAIATAPGKAGVGVVRISGQNLRGITKALFQKELSPRQASLLNLRDADGQSIDQLVAIYFVAPASFTGEDVLELQCHGGPQLLELVMKRCLELGKNDGLVIAEPGEFTLRAYLNNKMDLAQAEAIADLIDAQSEAAVRGAARSLQGAFSDSINDLIEEITQLRILVESTLDFPEEEIEFLENAQARARLVAVNITGQIGKPGSGLHPLRGQNNVQGASDAGLIPMMFPNYQRVDNPEAHAWFEKFWGTPLDKKPGYTVVEIMHKITAPDSDPDKIRGMYIEGENPAMSDPDLNHARHALASLEHLVVQDIFMTETALLADVVLPASAWPEKVGTASNTDRMVQMGKKAIEPPGDAKPDLWIIQEIAKRMGLNWNYQGPDAGVAAVYDEMRQAMHGAINGITWERLEKESSVTYPCLSAEDPGRPIVFDDSFATDDGKVKLVPADTIPANERPDGEYPFVLITGRQLEHWHTGSMTRRATILDAIEPMATVSMNGEDMTQLGVSAGDVITVQSRRGEVGIHVRRDDGTPRGVVFIPFAYYEAAANLITNPALDPFGKIPEFKYCAVKLAKGGQVAKVMGYGTNDPDRQEVVATSS
jgi:formylmethanofuran dehydrogenase subunit D